MKRINLIFAGCFVARAVFAADPALTIYNQNFAVVRDTVRLNLNAGVNDISYNQATMHLEPDSVVLRDPTGKHTLQILEQNFRADPVSQALLLNYYEGKTIEFESKPPGAQGKKEIIRGKIVRSGYVPHTQAFSQYGQDYYQSQMEFTGENTIDHTPRDEMIRVATGNAFDIVGERKRTNHNLDNNKRLLDESFATTLRNHKKEPVEIRIVEHLYRWPSWEITEKSIPFTKTDAQTIEFRVEVKPDAEETVTYTAH
jgi:hypothetical protein